LRRRSRSWLTSSSWSFAAACHYLIL
jgi:hypothetical protein